jgi:hypothetical protein
MEAIQHKKLFTGETIGLILWLIREKSMTASLLCTLSPSLSPSRTP